MKTTFRQLDSGHNAVNPDRSSLESWYEKVADVPIDDLSIEDLCRACRQDLHLPNVLPVAFDRVRINPIAGHMFDGELASAIARIPAHFWAAHANLKKEAKEVLRAARPELDQDAGKEVESFLAPNP